MTGRSQSNYICQVNEVKLADILFYLRFRPSVRPSVSTHVYMQISRKRFEIET